MFLGRRSRLRASVGSPPFIGCARVNRQIKNSEQVQKIPIVILTTSNAETDVAKIFEHHANSYLVKPLDFAEFIQLVSDLGFYWLAYNQCPWP